MVRLIKENNNRSNEWERLSRKSVLDTDGFTTDYTLYRNTIDGTYICMFGDSDIYEPDVDNADWVGEPNCDPYEWFDNYEGFVDEDNLYESINESVSGVTGKTWNEFISNIIKETPFVPDSNAKVRPNDFICLYKDGIAYEGEVTHYYKSGYELLYDNIYEDSSYDF